MPTENHNIQVFGYYKNEPNKDTEQHYLQVLFLCCDRKEQHLRGIEAVVISSKGATLDLVDLPIEEFLENYKLLNEQEASELNQLRKPKPPKTHHLASVLEKVAVM